eukprot:Unigene9046_Nuclearia_a/m.27676 Unigene9046_Nuclearia_a/g.27676  ORF Unigene9046_Nuclearia_a/g.27676 Unigene9046_Nuclearia_a/m.27676 type:complete len:419 (+) Unigene9046_Nuclearia_a:190-1446(+)
MPPEYAAADETAHGSGSPAAIPKVVVDTARRTGSGSGGGGDGGSPWVANAVFVVATHVAALATVALTTPTRATLLALAPMWWLTMLGITAGYHRLWSHRAYAASLPLRVFLAVCGTNGFQGSIKWWVLRHRLHHRFTDTEDDPYSSKKGFWYSHIGWIFEKPHYPKMKLIDASDLNADPVVVFQHKHYVALALAVGFAGPMLLAGLWGDVWGGLLWGGFVLRVLIWHSTFCINSVAHWIGDQDFSRTISARGNVLCSLLTNGEGYHNFHHAFPKDYRNGVQWYDWDPTKWAIAAWGRLGLARDLYVSDANEIAKARLLVAEQILGEMKSQLRWGPDEASLPVLTLAEVAQQQAGRPWTVIDGFALDLTTFMSRHPGGDKILKAFLGKDASKAFNGGMNMHTEAARELQRMFRVARVSS